MAISDDHLSACLLWLAKANGKSSTHHSLTDGLPLVDGRLSPSLVAKAAERIGVKVTLVRQPLEKLNQQLLPCIVLLEVNRACLLVGLDTATQQVSVKMPELDMQLQVLDLAEFKASYSGIALYCRSGIYVRRRFSSK